MLKFHGGSLLITKTARELLFDGYEDKLLHYIKEFPNLPNINIPFTKFGWFAERNGSEAYDGRFNMYTGTDSLKNLGILNLWNHEHKTRYYRDNCSIVRGTTGELWPPINTTTGITLYATDFCRSINLVPDSKNSLFNLNGYKFVGDDSVFDNGSKYKEAWCYCTSALDKCPDLPSGVLNVSDCKFGAPAFVSYPHFYLADPVYLDKIDGLSPNRTEHEFSITLEPKTGIPLEIRALLQLNILLQKIDHLR